MDYLSVLRVQIEGPVTSFRYPHFAQGVHPTFEMPPPATIYGLLSGVLGSWLPEPEAVEFGYTFTQRAKFEDYEHLHFEGTMNPFRRHLLFDPRLTLYMSYPDLERFLVAFRSPHYALSLGRSQDLMTCTEAEIVTLEAADEAYFEGTLLTPALAPHVDGSTITLTMARFIDERRQPQWSAYAMLRGKGRYPADGLRVEGASRQVWVDPAVREWGQYPDLPRGVIFHRFVGEPV